MKNTMGNRLFELVALPLSPLRQIRTYSQTIRRLWSDGGSAYLLEGLRFVWLRATDPTKRYLFSVRETTRRVRNRIWRDTFGRRVIFVVVAPCDGCKVQDSALAIKSQFNKAKVLALANNEVCLGQHPQKAGEELPELSEAFSWITSLSEVRAALQGHNQKSRVLFLPSGDVEIENLDFSRLLSRSKSRSWIFINHRFTETSSLDHLTEIDLDLEAQTQYVTSKCLLSEAALSLGFVGSHSDSQPDSLSNLLTLLLKKPSQIEFIAMYEQVATDWSNRRIEPFESRIIDFDQPIQSRQTSDTFGQPSVEIIIPTRDKPLLLEACIESVSNLNYPNLSLTVIDNGSVELQTLEYLYALEKLGIKVIRDPRPFNYSQLNNGAAAKGDSDLICFLNNDVVGLDDSWLSSMVAQVLRPGVAIVGPKLLFPNGTLQHVGLALGGKGTASHSYIGVPESLPTLRNLTNTYHEVSAVTGACLLIWRKDFIEVGGFDEKFEVGLNDVDLCMRVRQTGKRILFDPRARLTHLESASRGKNIQGLDFARAASEVVRFRMRWNKALTEKFLPY